MSAGGFSGSQVRFCVSEDDDDEPSNTVLMSPKYVRPPDHRGQPLPALAYYMVSEYLQLGIWTRYAPKAPL